MTMSWSRVSMKIEACIKVMLKISPIFGYVLHEMDRVSSNSVPTMGVGFVDKEARVALYYNPEFVSAMPEDVLVKVILPHEVAHIINGHLGRYTDGVYKRMKRKFVNIGLDMAINNKNYIEASLLPKLDAALKDYCGRDCEAFIEKLKAAAKAAGQSIPEDALEEMRKRHRDGIGSCTATSQGFPEEMTSDFYLAELLKKAEENQSGEGESCLEDEPGEGEGEGDGDGKGDGEGSGEGKPGSGKGKMQMPGGFDSHEWQNSKLSETTQQSLNRQVVSAGYKEWANAGKHRGNVPSDVIDQIEGFLYPKIPITRAFHNCIGSMISSQAEPSYDKVHRRTGTYMYPGNRIKTKLHLAIVVDTSGSMGSKELQLFRGLISRVQRELDPEITLFHSDTQVAKEEKIKSGGGKFTIPKKFHGRGGTDFNNVFDVIREKHYKPDGVIFFTDGCGALDSSKADPYRVLWIITPGGSTYDFMKSRKSRVLKLSDCDCGEAVNHD